MERHKNEGIKRSRYYDFSLLFILIFLLGFGLVMIYSTSSYSASLAFDGDGLYYLRKQVISTIVGLVVMVIVALFPYKFYIMLAPFAYVFSILTIGLIVTPLGYTANGARRWIRVAGLSIQPAEIAKIGVIMVTALIILNFKDRDEKFLRSWKYTLIVLAPAFVASVMIYGITSNLSSAIIVGGIAFMMLVISSPKCYPAYVLLLLLLVAAGGIVVYLYIKSQSGEDLSELGFRFERILAWFDPERYSDGKGFQTLQALYGIGSGGAFGKGLGKSMQKLGFLPEAYNDMIFSVICEELGLFGGLAIILMFILLLYRFFDISMATKDVFGNLLIVGVFAHIAIQVILNIAVVTNTIPNTGISLPFISYGGSSVIFLLAEMGIVLNVASHADFTRPVTGRRRVRRPVETESDENGEEAVDEE